MKTYWGSEVQLHTFFDLGTKWSASYPSSFTPRERAPGTHLIEGWVGPRAGMDTVSKGIIPKTNPGHPIVQSVASRYTD
jgi:hypothetical protein